MNPGMSAALLLITHNRIGDELLATATAMLGRCPLTARVLPVTANSDLEALQRQAEGLVAALEAEGQEVIVLTDMYGSTPANIARRLQHHHDQLDVITGLNLPMLVRLFNYPRLDRAQLVAKALGGGREGIFSCGSGEEEDGS